MKQPLAKRRTFLFLQGPPGPFFAKLGVALERAGYGVRRVNFNGGDQVSWPKPAINYAGTAGRWPQFFQMLVAQHDITDVVLFGDCRPLHQSAHGIARLNNLRIHVFEEGYIRPDWVTLELDGVNGHSTLSRDPAWYLEAARNLPPLPSYPPIASSFKRRAREALAYYTRGIAYRWRFPRYRSHRPDMAWLEGLGWIKRFATAGLDRVRSRRVLDDLGNRPYFVFPLQLNSDHQIRVHSPFGNMRTALSYVADSFARSAPDDVILVIKQHPLDNGLINWRRVVAAEARKRKIADRVRFLEEGDIVPIVAGAKGLVTINSTTGTLSLGAGVPTIVLGNAVYNIAGITHQEPLDAFWSAPIAPVFEIWDAFCRVMRDRCLIRGGFLSEEGLQLLVEGSLARLTRTPLLEPASLQPAPFVL